MAVSVLKSSKGKTFLQIHCLIDMISIIDSMLLKAWSFRFHSVDSKGYTQHTITTEHRLHAVLRGTHEKEYYLHANVVNRITILRRTQALKIALLISRQNFYVVP